MAIMKLVKITGDYPEGKRNNSRVHKKRHVRVKYIPYGRAACVIQRKKLLPGQTVS